MASVPNRDPEYATGSTNGLEILRQIWRIPKNPQRVAQAPANVSTDIYHVPAISRRIPHRSHPKA